MFFVQELLQVGSNPFGESDKDLVLKIVKDMLVVFWLGWGNALPEGLG